jgi:hypothetical protein
MSRHEDNVILRQMLDHIEEAVALARNRTRADLESDRVFFLALLKLVNNTHCAGRCTSPRSAR